MNITQLTIYPVKSLRGVTLDQAKLHTRGLAFDRHWMVVDADGGFVTQRQVAEMARVTVNLYDDSLVLEHPSAKPLTVSLAGGDQPMLEVTVWKDRCQALDEGQLAAHWLSRVLGGAYRLVRFPSTERRDVETDFLRGESAHTAFADGYPFLVVSESSLAELNRVLASKGLDAVPMSRFRPSIVVDGEAPFAEDTWATLASLDETTRLGLRKPCKRCKITTIDQQTGQIVVPGEPLRTLVEMNTRRDLQGGFFGQNATLLAGEGSVLRVGDAVMAGKKDHHDLA
ncbi:MOSC N-terminal beta barrel domain-containing protein [Halomonas sp. TRM85114]|uniref:MOSC domain-containing protein n=1 Tax=Halomonas jincaotanensis TaxID=2810616 RepID=UPI001BD3E8A3|nr:MOSC N-terminal beta barrel domain-containing protein [Halomonas jincaotanensis]MBS9404526.1 MOSC N-terminal beta barrel domain-containing protein [Halomonas jincaotanensis]